MKKNYFRLIAFIFLIASLSPLKGTAQLIRLSQGFDNYIGSVATVPVGWYISWNSTSSPSYYITSGNYGATIPAYKFANNGDEIISPYFLSGDTLRFWYKGQGLFSAQNSLSILYSSDSTSWNILVNPDTLLVTGTTFSYPLPCQAHYLMFIYHQVSGNLAFDDVLVTMTNFSPDAVAVTTLNLHCAGDTVCFFDMSTMAGCDSILSRVWNFGDSTATDSSASPCHIFSQAGNYNVKLFVTARNGNSDSTSLNISINPVPSAQFSAVNTTGTVVDFTDLSSVSSGSIASWFWNFADSTLSIQQNPMHAFPSVGTFFVCLTATSSSGCPATVCDSVYVIGAGVEDYQSEFLPVSFTPNPAQNEIEVHVPDAGDLLPQFEMFDLTGNKFLISGERIREETFHLALPHVADGIYFLKVMTDRKSAVLKILIAH